MILSGTGTQIAVKTGRARMRWHWGLDYKRPTAPPHYRVQARCSTPIPHPSQESPMRPPIALALCAEAA